MTNEDGSVRTAYKYKYKKGVGIVDSEGNQIIQLLAVDCSKVYLAAVGKKLAQCMNMDEYADVWRNHLCIYYNHIIELAEERNRKLLEDNDRLVKLVAELEAAAKK